MNVDWEMKARQLAENLRTMGFIVTLSGLCVMLMAEGAVSWLGGWMIACGLVVMADARIEP